MVWISDPVIFEIANGTLLSSTW